MEYTFVDTTPGGNLWNRMMTGGLNAIEAGYDEVCVTVAEGEEWVDEDAWVHAIEEHYACVFNDSNI
jgi:hypothetical protein